MAYAKCRVYIPQNPEELLTLADKVYKKHTELAVASPLNAMVSHKWSDNGPKVNTCLDLHNRAEELRRLSEEAFRQRDLLLEEIDNSVKASRDLLLGVYRETPKVLGEYGFEVDDSAHSKP